MKKIPMRKCVATNESLPKKELIRIVRTPEGTIEIDETGKRNGRGAYLKRSVEALEAAMKRKSLVRSLECEIPEEIYDKLILAEDIGDNAKKKLNDKCSFYKVPCVYMDGALMNMAIGDRNRKAIAILDKGFAEKIAACLKG